ncbi:MAG: heat-inducible transcriptional repressor HrcA [Syntrophotaleaceae bacterium]
MNERSRQILQAIIEDYTSSGEPVGSRAVARRQGINLSPATVRNVMADLEEMGYLYSPHTSAGRVPTEEGYRFYLASLLHVRELTLEEREQIRQHYHFRDLQTEERLREAGRLLSTASRYAGIVMVPRFTSTVFRRIEFVSLGPTRLLVVFLTQAGIIQHKLIEVNEPLNRSQLDEATNYLNEAFSGLTIQQIKVRIAEEIRQERAVYDKLRRRALLLSSQALQEEFGGQVFIEGTSNILEQPEFADLEKMRRLLRAFEQKSLLIELLDKTQQVEGVQIFIGSHDEYSEIEGCSLVTASYSNHHGTTGTLGIIGPTRMPYSLVIPLVDYTARLVSDMLSTD